MIGPMIWRLREMLRLTVKPGPARRAVLAEGRLVGEWAALLETECLRLLREGGGVELDLGAVTDVDSHGLSTLRRLRHEAIVLLGLSPLMQALLAEEANP